MIASNWFGICLFIWVGRWCWRLSPRLNLLLWLNFRLSLQFLQCQLSYLDLWLYIYLLFQPISKFLNLSFLDHLCSDWRLVIGLTIPIGTLNLSLIEKPTIHNLNTLLSCTLFLELNLNNSLRMRLVKPNPLNCPNFLTLSLDVFLGLEKQCLILKLVRCKHVLHNDNLESITNIFLIPIQLPLLIFFSQQFIDFVHLFRVSRLVLFVLLVELCSLDFDLEAWFDLSLIEHL